MVNLEINDGLIVHVEVKEIINWIGKRAMDSHFSIVGDRARKLLIDTTLGCSIGSVEP